MIFSIVIPSKGPSASLDRLLASCLKQNFVKTEFEIITVSSASYKSSLVIDSSTEIHHLRIQENNVSKARNEGAKLSRGNFVLFLDDDTVLLRSDFLQNLFDRTSSFTNDFALGGGYSDLPENSLMLRATNTISNIWIDIGAGSPAGIFELKNAQVLLGGNLCVPNKLIKKVCFPENIPWGGEDSVFCKRLRDLSIDLFFSESLNVGHGSRGTFKKFLKRSWLSGKTRATLNTQQTHNRKILGLVTSILSLDLILQVPLILMHFSILEISQIYYRLRQSTLTNKP